MTFLLIFQSILSLALITLVVIQAKGTGLGRAFGSTNYHSKRGMEKTAFYTTIVLSFIFVALSIRLAI